MALYVSVARRRRRAAIVALVASALCLAVGVTIGRQQVPSLDARVASVETRAGDVATGLERLNIEYQQVRDGTDSLEESVLTPFAELLSLTQETMDQAPWLTPSQRNALLEALAVTRQSALDGDPVPTFQQHADAAAALVRGTFGVLD